MSEYLEGYINQAVYLASAFPLVGDAFKAIDTMRYYDDYFANRGLSWADVEYPTRLSTSGFSGLTSYVSDNIKELYK